MKQVKMAWMALFVCLMLLCTFPAEPATQSGSGLTGGMDTHGLQRPRVSLGVLPLYFIPNQGQVHEKAAFYARTSGYTLWLTPEEMIFDAPGDGEQERDVSGLKFVGANLHPTLSALNLSDHRVDFFRGQKESSWKTGIRTSKAVLYQELYPGIDLKVYGMETQVEYDWIVKPGGDPKEIRWKYFNIKNSGISPTGNLQVNMMAGQLVHQKPVCYQWQNGEKVAVSAEYVRLNNNCYGLQVGVYDRTRELIIDPLVQVYGSFLGGWLDDTIADMAVDNNGNIYLVGTTANDSFPLYNSFQASGETFVMKLHVAADGSTTLTYSGYIGGTTGKNVGYGIAVDNAGLIYVAGYTESTDFPLRHAYQDHLLGPRDTFVATLDTSRSGSNILVFATYFGGNDSDVARDIAVDNSGNAYITGSTYSPDWPFSRGLQSAHGGGIVHYSDAFITKLDTHGIGLSVLKYSSYLASNWIDSGNHIAVDTNGHAYICGFTKGADFPVKNGFQTVNHGPLTNEPGGDIFLTRINTNASGADSLVYSTYLGGAVEDVDGGLAIDNNGHAFLTGYTCSGDFPILNGYQDYLNWSQDVFVTRIDTSKAGAASLLYSTYLGGRGKDEAGTGIVIDAMGNAYITGHTASPDFPVLHPLQESPGGGVVDAFVTKLNATGNALLFSSYLGGNHFDYATAIALDNEGSIYVVGNTKSSVFPVTPGGFQQLMGGGWDGFVVKIKDSDIIPPDTPRLWINRNQTYFGATQGMSGRQHQYVLVRNTGGGTMNWSTSSNQQWLRSDPENGVNDDMLTVAINPAGLLSGTYTGDITINAPDALCAPQHVTVTLHVYSEGSTAVPFGSFETPTNGATVMGSIPVTGWALDDLEVSSVKIYRLEGGSEVYIGDASFVEGARPDVEIAYPTYPNSYRAGWGYMMLTNFLPDGGNGLFTLVAKAIDLEGNEVVLGTKTITCDNAHASKPFGAIDTPEQGQWISGKDHVNFGWVLTPQPNNIPTNGSTIKVWVDGVALGSPVYNQYRQDIATLFPGYANSNGAVGYYHLDTTAYENGLHTIQWTATDNVGNSDGIGSRYFIIQNGTTGNSDLSFTDSLTTEEPAGILAMPLDSEMPIWVRTGFLKAGKQGQTEGLKEIYPAENGTVTVYSKELEPIELHLGHGKPVRGWLQVQNQLQALPIGAYLDSHGGVFTWGPGPGFVGTYSVIFVLEDSYGNPIKKRVEIHIKPKY